MNTLYLLWYLIRIRWRILLNHQPATILVVEVIPIQEVVVIQEVVLLEEIEVIHEVVVILIPIHLVPIVVRNAIPEVVLVTTVVTTEIIVVTMIHMITNEQIIVM